MFSLLMTAFIGLLAGALAKWIMPGKDPGGILVTMALGVAGSFVASFIGRMLGFYAEGGGAGFFMSVLGAILILWVYKMATKGQGT